MADASVPDDGPCETSASPEAPSGSSGGAPLVGGGASSTVADTPKWGDDEDEDETIGESRDAADEKRLRSASAAPRCSMGERACPSGGGGLVKKGSWAEIAKCGAS